MPITPRVHDLNPEMPGNLHPRHLKLLRLMMPFALALVLASLSLWIFTRHNDFPKDYHPDEPSKIAQLVHPTQERNFNHPLLMLEAANAARMAVVSENHIRTYLW